MRQTYDIIYLTNTPSFYKLNLCERIAERGVKVLVVFYGYGSEAVNTDLSVSGKFKFDYEFINEGDSNTRNRIRTFWNLLKLMRRIKTKRIIYAGWLAPEYNLYSFLSSSKKNVMVCESSILDVSMSGLKGMLKRQIINRMNAVLPSGEPHKQLFDSIGYKGKCWVTGSVGIFDKSKRMQNNQHSEPLRYLFVGRLIEVKGLETLIEVFNENGLPLTIVGDGELRENLKRKVKNNIKFTGFIRNKDLATIYSEHDVFILPSIYEPWGLVIEEALYHGLPVIASDKVGSGIDMVKNLKTGLIFKVSDKSDLQRAIKKMGKLYESFKTSVRNIDWEKRETDQVNAYIEILK